MKTMLQALAGQALVAQALAIAAVPTHAAMSVPGPFNPSDRLPSRERRA